jgi:hypothetical protein
MGKLFSPDGKTKASSRSLIPAYLGYLGKNIGRLPPFKALFHPPFYLNSLDRDEK